LGQQDSQEFLRRTLDVLHEELALDLPPNSDVDASSEDSGDSVAGLCVSEQLSECVCERECECVRK